MSSNRARIIGIDPGNTGAIAYMDAEELIIWDMPTFQIEKNGKVRHRIDSQGIYNLLKDMKVDQVYIELVNALPGNGAAHSFTFGFGCGIIEGVVTACCLPFTMVSPMKWKAALTCPKDKDGARHRASQLMPLYSDNWKLKKHDGRAEAALIAYYGRNDF